MIILFEIISMHSFKNNIFKAFPHRLTVGLTIFSVLSNFKCLAQDSTGTKQEVWPELNVFYKFNPHFRFYANYSATKLKNSSYTDGGFGVYIDYFGFPVLRKKLGPNMRDSTQGYNLMDTCGLPAFIYPTRIWRSL